MIPATGAVIRDPQILGGTPIFRGTRVPFQALLDYLEGGQTMSLDDFPTVGEIGDGNRGNRGQTGRFLIFVGELGELSRTTRPRPSRQSTCSRMFPGGLSFSLS
jgi:hypothetical protein